jgi:hypothetical protein
MSRGEWRRKGEVVQSGSIGVEVTIEIGTDMSDMDGYF